MKIKPGIFNIWLILVGTAIVLVGIFAYASFGREKVAIPGYFDKTKEVALPPVGDSDNVSSLEAELKATDFSDVDAELADIDNNLNSE